MRLGSELEEDGFPYDKGDGENRSSVEQGRISSRKKEAAVSTVSRRESQGDAALPGLKDSHDNIRKLERLYYRLGLALYDEILRGGGKRLEIDNSIASLVKKIAVFRKNLGHFELERRIDQRFERLENQLEQLTSLICQRIPVEPEIPFREKLREPEESQGSFSQMEGRFKKLEETLEALRQNLPVSENPGRAMNFPVKEPVTGKVDSSLDQPDQPALSRETEEKARAKARAMAQTEAKAKMEARNQPPEVPEPEEETGIDEFPDRSEPVSNSKSKAGPEAIKKIRESVKDLQSLVKSRENKLYETKQKLNSFFEESDKPATEAAELPVSMEKAAEFKEDPKEGILPDNLDFSFSSRIDETQLFLQLAPVIPDSADRLSYLEFLRDLQCGSSSSRIVAAEGLIKWRIPQTEISLISAWKAEEESRVRAQIIKSLKTIRSNRILKVFREFQTKGKPRDQLMALEGFNRWGGEEGMKYIIEGLRSGHPMVRRRAVTYIGWSMYKKALPELVRRLRDPSLYVRKTTVAVVASFEDGSSVFFLLDSLNDEAESIRIYVFKILLNMTGKDFGYHPDASQTKRLEAIVAWKKWWRENEYSFKLCSPRLTGAAAESSKPEPPEPPVEKEVVLSEEPERLPVAAAIPAPKKDKPEAGKEPPVLPDLPAGSLEQGMYEILLRKSSEGMTIQEMGLSLNLPWQKLIQKTGLLQKSGWIYKDQNHHLFFPVLKQ